MQPLTSVSTVLDELAQQLRDIEATGNQAEAIGIANWVTMGGPASIKEAAIRVLGAISRSQPTPEVVSKIMPLPPRPPPSIVPSGFSPRSLDLSQAYNTLEELAHRLRDIETLPTSEEAIYNTRALASWFAEKSGFEGVIASILGILGREELIPMQTLFDFTLPGGSSPRISSPLTTSRASSPTRASPITPSPSAISRVPSPIRASPITPSPLTMPRSVSPVSSSLPSLPPATISTLSPAYTTLENLAARLRRLERSGDVVEAQRLLDWMNSGGLESVKSSVTPALTQVTTGASLAPISGVMGLSPVQLSPRSSPSTMLPSTNLPLLSPRTSSPVGLPLP